MTEKQAIGWTVVLTAACAFLLWSIQTHQPTPEQKYQQRVQAWINLPSSVGGSFPERDDPVAKPLIPSIYDR